VYRSWWRGSGGRLPPLGCLGPEPEREGVGVVGGSNTLASLRPASGADLVIGPGGRSSPAKR
jgi:hypothetical protein